MVLFFHVQTHCWSHDLHSPIYDSLLYGAGSIDFDTVLTQTVLISEILSVNSLARNVTAKQLIQTAFVLHLHQNPAIDVSSQCVAAGFVEQRKGAENEVQHSIKNKGKAVTLRPRLFLNCAPVTQPSSQDNFFCLWWASEAEEMNHFKGGC